MQVKEAEEELDIHEEELILDVQQQLSAELDGAAKLVVVGGLGAMEGKRSVFRSWPTIWQVIGCRCRIFSAGGPDCPSRFCILENGLMCRGGGLSVEVEEDARSGVSQRISAPVL